MWRETHQEITYGFNASSAGCKTCVGKLKLQIFSENCKWYLKNHWTYTMHVCTHLNAFFMLNLNMARKIWSTFFVQTLEIQLFISTPDMKRVYALYTGYRFVFGKLEILNFCLKIQVAISRSTTPILGLFVLIRMHISWWIQKQQWKFEFDFFFFFFFF